MADNGVNESFGRTWTWMAVLAAICIVGGFMALLNPFGATIFAVTIAGWVFLVQGIIQGDQVLASHNVSLSLGPGADYFVQPLAGTIRLAQGQP